MKRSSFSAAAIVIFAACTTSFGQAKKAPEPIGADHAEKMVKGLDVFKKHVKPIFEAKCLRCHGGKKIESDFDLSDRDGLLKGGQIGIAVVPGKSKESQLVKLVQHAKEPHMPDGDPKLPDAAIARIIEWIDLGAPYDNPLVASKLKGKSWTERTLPASAKNWWAFEPLKKTAAACGERRGVVPHADRSLHPDEAGRSEDHAERAGDEAATDSPSLFRPDRPAADAGGD